MKKTRISLFLFLFVIALGCGEKVVEPHRNLISKEKKTDVLHDLALQKAAKTSYSDVLEQKNVEIMDFLFRKYQIDSTQFVESDRYYASLPLEYQAIYEEVEARIEKKRKFIEEDNQKRNDSVRKAQEAKTDSLKKLRKDIKEAS